MVNESKSVVGRRRNGAAMVATSVAAATASSSMMNSNSNYNSNHNASNYNHNSHQHVGMMMMTDPSYSSNDRLNNANNNDHADYNMNAHVASSVNNNNNNGSSAQLVNNGVAPSLVPISFAKNGKTYTSYEGWFMNSNSSQSHVDPSMLGVSSEGDSSSDTSSSTSSSPSDDESVYDPLFLDDPKIRNATNRKIMHLPGLISSTVPFIKKRELEIDLNEQFREKHPNINLTLSKIRSLKKKMLRVCFPPTPFVNALIFNNSNQENAFIECSTIAMAIVYLEKLILKNCVNNQNRRLIAATCLFVAFKLNYEGGGSNLTKNFSDFWDAVEDNFSSVNRKQVLKFEFQLFAMLDFEINVPLSDLYPHMKRLLNQVNGLKAVDYMGEDLFHRYIGSKLHHDDHHHH